MQFINGDYKCLFLGAIALYLYIYVPRYISLLKYPYIYAAMGIKK